MLDIVNRVGDVSISVNGLGLTSIYGIAEFEKRYQTYLHFTGHSYFFDFFFSTGSNFDYESANRKNKKKIPDELITEVMDF